MIKNNLPINIKILKAIHWSLNYARNERSSVRIPKSIDIIIHWRSAWRYSCNHRGPRWTRSNPSESMSILKPDVGHRWTIQSQNALLEHKDGSINFRSSVRLCHLCDFVLEPRSHPAKYTRDRFLPLAWFSMSRSSIWNMTWEREDVSFASIAWIVRATAICCDENDGWIYEISWGYNVKPIGIYPFPDTVNIII